MALEDPPGLATVGDVITLLTLATAAGPPVTSMLGASLGAIRQEINGWDAARRGNAIIGLIGLAAAGVARASNDLNVPMAEVVQRLAVQAHATLLRGRTS